MKETRIIRTFLYCSAILTLLIGCQTNPLNRGPFDAPFKYRLNQVIQVGPNNIAVDFNDDGHVLFVQYIETISSIYPEKSGLIIRDENYQVISQNNIPGKMRYLDFPDCCGDGEKEVLVVFEKNDSCFVRIINKKGEEIINAFLFDGSPRNMRGQEYDWLGQVRATYFIDIDGDGEREFVVAANESFAASPRGIFVFDGKEFNLKWKYEIGPAINLAPEIVDFDGDGKYEILISTNSPDNGNIANGTSDTTAYVIMLSHDGELKWKRKYAEKYSSVYASAGDINIDGRLDIIAMLGMCGSESYPQINIEYLSPESGDPVLSRRLSDNTASSFVIMQASYDANKEIVVRDESGNIKLLDSELN